MEGWCGSGGGGMAVCVSRGEGVLGEKTETKLSWLKFRRTVDELPLALDAYSDTRDLWPNLSEHFPSVSDLP